MTSEAGWAMEARCRFAHYYRAPLAGDVRRYNEQAAVPLLRSLCAERWAPPSRLGRPAYLGALPRCRKCNQRLAQQAEARTDTDSTGRAGCSD